MKKRIIFVLGIIMCMILSVGIFTACATKKDASQKVYDFVLCRRRARLYIENCGQ